MSTPSPAPVDVFRAVALACRDGRIAVSGGGVLRLGDAIPCPPAIAGRIVAIALRGDRVIGVTTVIPTNAPPIRTLERDRYAVAPNDVVDDGGDVEVTVVVETPARTPATDDIYLATERSNWTATEARMDRIDVRRWRATLKIRRGARLAFRVSRGSLATGERENSGAVPAPHQVLAAPGEVTTVRVAAWADVS